MLKGNSLLINGIHTRQPLTLDLLKSPKYETTVNTSNWGPLLWCLHSSNFVMFDALVWKYEMNLRKELFLDSDGDIGELSSPADEMLPFLIVID